MAINIPDIHEIISGGVAYRLFNAPEKTCYLVVCKTCEKTTNMSHIEVHHWQDKYQTGNIEATVIDMLGHRMDLHYIGCEHD